MEHLPRRLLGGGAQKRIRKGREVVYSESDDDGEQMVEEPRINRAQWSKRDPGLVGSKIPEWTRPELDDDAANWRLEELTTAYEFYKLYQSDSFVEQVLLKITKLRAVDPALQKIMQIYSPR